MYVWEADPESYDGCEPDFKAVNNNIWHLHSLSEDESQIYV